MVTVTSDTLSHRARWVEFIALYLGAPLLIALFMPPRLLFPALFALTLVGLWLLHRTGGFDWRALLRGWGAVPWGQAGLVALATFVAGWVILTLTMPEARFAILRARPEFLLLIWALYPILSALPQELIFRPLFFHRFGALFPDRQSALLVNAAVFSLAHLMYWSWIVAAMTLIGGWIFARLYVARGFPAALVLHAVAGNVIFAVGMGAYFWTGNVTRPF